MRSAWLEPTFTRQRVAVVLEVEFETLCQRLLGVGEVDEGKSAQADGRLVHEAAGLAKVDVLDNWHMRAISKGVMRCARPRGPPSHVPACLDRCGRGRAPPTGMVLVIARSSPQACGRPGPS